MPPQEPSPTLKLLRQIVSSSDPAIDITLRQRELYSIQQEPPTDIAEVEKLFPGFSQMYRARIKDKKAITLHNYFEEIEDYIYFYPIWQVADAAINKIQELFPFLPKLDYRIFFLEPPDWVQSHRVIIHGASGGLSFGASKIAYFISPWVSWALAHDQFPVTFKYYKYSKEIPNVNILKKLLAITIVHEYLHGITEYLTGVNFSDLPEGNNLGNALAESVSVLMERILAFAIADNINEARELVAFRGNLVTKRWEEDEYMFGYTVFGKYLKRRAASVGAEQTFKELIEVVTKANFTKLGETPLGSNPAKKVLESENPFEEILKVT